MSTLAHRDALERRHREIDQQIQSELLHASQDPLLLKSLKVKKLEIKDQMSRFDKDVRH